jgi:formate dehydrogenase subunit delta
MSPDKLAYMANQIGKFFIGQGHDKAVAGVAEHITKFWDPRMRETIVSYWKAGGAKLDPCVREAVGRLAQTEIPVTPPAHKAGPFQAIARLWR